MSKGVSGVTTCLQLSCTCDHSMIDNCQLTWGSLATSTYGDLHPGSRWLGNMLQNLSALEVRIPPKTIIDNVQMAVSSSKYEGPCAYTDEVLPLKEQKGWSEVGQFSCLNSPKK